MYAMEQSAIAKLANPVVQAMLDEVIQLLGVRIVFGALSGLLRAHAYQIEEAPHGMFLKLFYKVLEDANDAESDTEDVREINTRR